MTVDLTDDEVKLVVDGIRNLNVNVPIANLVDGKPFETPQQVLDLLEKFKAV